MKMYCVVSLGTQECIEWKVLAVEFWLTDETFENTFSPSSCNEGLPLAVLWVHIDLRERKGDTACMLVCVKQYPIPKLPDQSNVLPSAHPITNGSSYLHLSAFSDATLYLRKGKE